ncbi:MAG: hypothetical protein ACKVXR_12480 [Planctomycetota bacterium]
MNTHTSSDPAPAVRDLARRLLAQGASPAFAKRIVSRVEAAGRRREDAHPLDLAARVIGDSFQRVVLRASRGGPACLAVLGAPGCGRSTVVRKLALRLCGAGRRVAVLAVRQRESSTPEWMATWMGEIGAFAEVVDDDAEVPRACGDADVVLLDGSGDLPRDTALVERLGRIGALAQADWTRIGVLAGDAGFPRLREDARSLCGARARCLVVTRLDLARTPAAAFEAAFTTRLPVAFASAGIGEADHLFRCGPERAADVFLKGRIE